MVHKNEIIRWANSPQGTMVWECDKCCTGDWSLTNSPAWGGDKEYVVNDEYADFRKQWIDNGKPEMQYLSLEGEWEDCNGEPEWNLVLGNYRIKEQKWHNSIPKQGILCWVKDDHWCVEVVDLILSYDPKREYPYEGVNEFWKIATPMKESEVSIRTYSDGKEKA